MRIKYKGLDGKGAGVSGTLELTDLADFVERKYRQGWRRLQVMRDGEQVAGIETLPWSRAIPRTWWSE